MIERLRVAMLAPPWIPVPPPGYGGIEEVVRLLCAGLVARGHEVTLFAPPGSRSPAQVHAVLEAAHEEAMGLARYEADHVARAFAAIDRAAEDGHPFGVVHDHSGFTALAMADRLDVPVVHTLHSAFSDDMRDFYGAHHAKALIVAISRAQRDEGPDGVATAPVVPNPIAVEEWPFASDKEPFLLWVGRMSPDKGPHRAVRAARAAGLPLVLAGPVQAGQEAFFRDEVEPDVDGVGIRYLGEIGREDKKALFARARALLMPIRWPEPFGLVMVEAMACGTPVIAFPAGAAPEVVVHGETGFLVDDEDEMGRRALDLQAIDPVRCRSAAEERFGVSAVIAGYEELYERAARGRPGASAASGRVAGGGSRRRFGRSRSAPGLAS